METLVLDGREFVKASKAAKDLGYTADHVGQLCRSGKVTAHLVGRTWYVRKDELSDHKVEKKRILRAKAREYAKKSIEEHRKKAAEMPQAAEKKLVLRYEDDDRELIPQVRKVNVTAIPVEERLRIREEAEETETVIENEGDKILMSGSISVTDVTDGEPDTETVFLKPKILKSPARNQKPREPQVVEPVADENSVLEAPQSSFKDRLAAVHVRMALAATDEDIEADDNDSEAEPIDEDVHKNQKKGSGSVIGYLAVLLVVCICLFFNTIAVSTMTYTSTDPNRLDKNVSFPIQALLENLGL